MLHSSSLRPTGHVARSQARRSSWLEREKEEFRDWKLEQEATLQEKWEELHAEERERRRHVAAMEAKVDLGFRVPGYSFVPATAACHQVLWQPQVWTFILWGAT